MVYRRFGFLHARLLLHKQDELRVMEEALDEMDQKDRCSDEPEVLQCREDDDARTAQGAETRKSLLSRIEETLLKYGNIAALTTFTHSTNLLSRRNPSTRTTTSTLEQTR